MAKGNNADALYRVSKFPIYPSEEQIIALRTTSDNLWEVWNDALHARVNAFETHLTPLYKNLRQAVEMQDSIGVRRIRKEMAVAYKSMPTLYDQINSLTEKRRNGAFGRIPRNWQEETLDALDGAYKSFLALRKRGDYDARPPRERSERAFSEIPGRSGFKIADGHITLSAKYVPAGMELKFSIPNYQQGELARAIGIKKFILFRTPSDMKEAGRFWVSIAYELPQPESKPFVPIAAAYVCLGASSIGIVSPQGEIVIDLWRPDKHWKPKIDEIEEPLKRCAKDSRQWRKLITAKRKMFRLMAVQQKQNHREVVARLVREYGAHFVVTDLVVRSKKGKLADAERPERSGSLGLNWSAQNTGSLAALVAQLEMKARENGGEVRRFQFVPPQTDLRSRERKVPFARLLREQYLQSL